MSTKTIADTTKLLICVVDAMGIGLSINEILERIHVEHPGCKTTKSCVSWYLSKAKSNDLKNFVGVLPRERARSTGAAKVTATVTAPVMVEPTDAEKWRDAAAILVSSSYTTANAVKYINKMAEALDIEAVIEAKRAEAVATVETEEVAKTTEVEEVNEFENDEAIPLTEDDEEIDMNLTDEELEALVAVG